MKRNSRTVTEEGLMAAVVAVMMRDHIGVQLEEKVRNACLLWCTEYT